MSHWERREADTLADAIGKHIKANPDLVKENRELARIQLSVDAAATTINTDAGELHRFRTDVCSICRNSNLYECDVAEGWSSECAFVIANASQFADL